jgi:hypothetical protein
MASRREFLTSATQALAASLIPPAVAGGWTGWASGSPLPSGLEAFRGGQGDATDLLQRMINTRAGRTPVRIPAGIYNIDAERSLRLPAGCTLELAAGTVLRAIPNGAPGYAILLIDGVEGVTVRGGLLQGERDRHRGSTGEWGMGIRLNGARRVRVENVRISDCWGDGIYFGAGRGKRPCSEITVRGCELRNNRRQAISVISCLGGTIENCTLAGTHGTRPGCGLDLEPNEGDRIGQLRVRGNRISGNAGDGIHVEAEKGPIWDCSFEGNTCVENGGHGILMQRGARGLSLAHNRVHDNARNGIRLEGAITGSHFDANQVYHNGRDLSGEWDELLLAPNQGQGPSGNRFTANILGPRLPGARSRHTVRVQSRASQANQFIGNRIAEGRAALADGGSGTVVSP